MKQTSKRVTSLLMAFAMLMGMMTAVAVGAAEPVIEYVEVTVDAGNHGTVTINGEAVAGPYQASKGSDIALIIIPDQGYEIASVTVNGVVTQLVGNIVTIRNIQGNTSVAITYMKGNHWIPISGHGPYDFNTKNSDTISTYFRPSADTEITVAADPDDTTNKVMKYVSNEAGKRVTEIASITFEPGKKYKVSARIKTESGTSDFTVGTGGAVRLKFRRSYQIDDGNEVAVDTNDRDKLQSGEYAGYIFRGDNGATTNWKTVSFIMDVKETVEDASASTLYISFANAGTYYIDDYMICEYIEPKAPVVTSVAVIGTSQAGCTVTAKSVISDQDKEDLLSVTYQWQVKKEGTWEDIPGADEPAYTIAEGQSEIRVVATPWSNRVPFQGTPVPSEAKTVMPDTYHFPWGEQAQIEGLFEIGQTLRASYIYQSPIPRANTLYVWEVSSDGTNYTTVQISTDATYTVKMTDANRWLRVCVIPTDENGVSGDAVVSETVKIEGTATLYVSATGNDMNEGSYNKPFKTIQRARDAIRELPSLPEGGVVVNIMGGTYSVTDTVIFTQEDSGTKGSPIIYQAYNGEKVVFSGSQVLDTSKIQKVTEEEVLNRLNEERAKDHLYMLDLDEQNVTVDALESYGHGYYNYKPKQIYMNNNRLTEARWPNDDQSQNMLQCRALTNADDGIDENQFNTSKKPIKFEYPDPKNRSAKWNIKSGDAYVGGAVVYFWAPVHLLIDSIDVENKIVTSLDPSSYGFESSAGTLQHKVYFSNIFAEIDKPGESYIDREENILYFYPLGSMKNPTMEIATLDKNMVSFTGVSYVSFKGIDFKNTVETPVVLTDCHNMVMEDGELSNISAGGISMTDCTNTTITDCNFYTIGTNALVIDGGDRVNLTSSGNEVKNNIFHNIGHLASSNFTMLQISNAAGEWIHHNEFNDTKTDAIRMVDSNDVLIEYNKIMNAGTLNSDAGAIYWGREFYSLGHTIRYNYFENIGSKLVSNYLHAEQSVSIMTDDSSTGGNIYGNVFLNGGSNRDGTGSATVGNGPEFANVWGNISICTDFDRMSKSFQMRNWGDATSFVPPYTGLVEKGVAASSWTYQMGKGVPFGRTGISTRFNKTDLNRMWSKAWIEHYGGTHWEGALNHYGKDVYESFMEKYDEEDYEGALQVLNRKLTHERTNKIHDNVSLGATIMDSLATHFDNYNGTQGEITEEDKALFVDFDNKDFTLTDEGLKKIQQTAPQFKPILFNQIGLTSKVGGDKPVVTVNPEIYTITEDQTGISPSYTFTDADGDEEGNTKIYWHVSDTENGKYEQIYGGVEGDYFEVTEEYLGKYLKYEIVPYDTTMLRGEAVWSDAIRITKENFPGTVTNLSFVDSEGKEKFGWSNGDTIKADSVYYNDQERTVYAKIYVALYQGNMLMSVISSETKEVKPGEGVYLTTDFLVIPKTGEYQVKQFVWDAYSLQPLNIGKELPKEK